MTWSTFTVNALEPPGLLCSPLLHVLNSSAVDWVFPQACINNLNFKIIFFRVTSNSFSNHSSGKGHSLVLLWWLMLFPLLPCWFWLFCIADFYIHCLRKHCKYNRSWYCQTPPRYLENIQLLSLPSKDLDIVDVMLCSAH